QSEYSPLDRELMGVAENIDFIQQKFGNIKMEVLSDHKPLEGDGWRKLELEQAKGRAKESQ
ncbi:MAG TPA: hypothetical protein VGD26_10710, partial [Chitinophagaceae bacterium]